MGVILFERQVCYSQREFFSRLPSFRSSGGKYDRRSYQHRSGYSTVKLPVSREKADNVSRLSHWLPPVNVHPRKVHPRADPRWHSEELRIQVAFQKIKRYHVCESTFTGMCLWLR